jgi:hypothetical protein
MAAAGTDPPETTPHTRLELADDQIKRWRTVIDGIRSRTDLTAKAAAGLGSSILGAVGIAKFSDVFPLPDDVSKLQAAVPIVGFALVAVSLGCIIVLLARVGQPVLSSARLQEITGASKGERELIMRTYDEIAALKGAPSLQAYEARAQRYARLAAETDDVALKKRLEGTAMLINAEVQAAQGRATADVVRRRSAQALAGKWATAWYAVGVAGVIMFAVGSDYLDGKRSGDTELAKAKIANEKECAAVAKTYADAKLEIPKINGCPPTTTTSSGSSDKQADEPTPAQIRAQAVEVLAPKNTACQATTKDAATEDCARIAEALSRLSPEGG